MKKRTRINYPSLYFGWILKIKIYPILLYNGYVVPPYYDSLLGKLVVHAPSREECLAKLRRSLEEFVIEGIATLIPLHKKLANDLDVIRGEYDIHWLRHNLGRFVSER
jgi:acetyl-CoA carboxylase biotin carboxylase subunit